MSADIGNGLLVFEKVFWPITFLPRETSVLERDKINPTLDSCYLKEAYYWTIVLATRPYLIDLVQRHIAHETARPRQSSVDDDVLSPQTQQSDTLLAYASVNSAVLTIDLLQCFLLAGEIPNRLSYAVNSILDSALVLGIGYLTGLDRLFPWVMPWIWPRDC